MPIIRGNAKFGPSIISVSVISPFSPLNAIGVACRALLDTGADGTSINRNVAESAGLQSRGKVLVTGIGGQNYHRSWAIKLGFFSELEPSSFPYVLEDPFLAIEMPPYHAFEVIIGRDILMLGDFQLSSNGDFILSLPGQSGQASAPQPMIDSENSAGHRQAQAASQSARSHSAATLR